MSSSVFPTLVGQDIKVERSPIDDVQASESASGKEIRQTASTYPRYRFQVDFNILRSDATMADPLRQQEWQQFFTHVARHFGRLDSFLFTDPDDNAVTDHGFALGDGSTTAFQLQRTLGGGITDAYGEWPASTKPRTNLLLRSQDWTNAAWSTQTGGTGVAPIRQANMAVAPDGTPTASRVRLDRGAGVTSGDISRVFQASIPVLPVANYAYSVWMRTVDGTTQQVEIEVFAGVKSIVAVTGTWQRFQVSGASANNSTQNGAMLTSIGSDPTSSQVMDVYIWGGQFELGASATQYIATTSAAVTVNPTYWPGYADGYEPVTELNGPISLFLDGDWQQRRQLFQTARTNIALQSQTFDNASWAKVSSSVTANATAGPDGTTTADKLVEDGTTNQHRLDQTTTLAAGNCVFSTWAKSAERSQLQMRIGLSGGGFTYDVTAGTVSGSAAGYTASIQRFSNGHMRCALIGPCAAADVVRLNMLNGGVQSYAGDGTSGLYLWGAQVEQVVSAAVATPTQYIPTTTAAVTVTDFTLSGGVVTPVAVPAAGLFLSWTGSYFRRVRFDMDSVPSSRLAQSMYEAKQVRLVSCK